MTFIIKKFSSMTLKSSDMIGYCTVETPPGVVFKEVSIHYKDGLYYAVPGRRQKLGEDGLPILIDGRPIWIAVVYFKTLEIRNQFSQLVISALRASYPEVFRHE
jgi:hypothetical protein